MAPDRDRIRALLIAGPTASGKSALALALAERVGGEIVNADAMQLYADLSVVTARPGPEETERVPHHLYGVWPASFAGSAQAWAKLALAAIEEIEGRGRLPILAGGTGLYFRTLVEGLARIPSISPEIREAVRAEVAHDLAGAFRRLGAVDPALAARLAPADRQRIARGLEVFDETGRPLSFWQATPRTPLLSGASARFVLRPERAWLYARCDARFDQMMAAGALDEVKALAARDLPADLPAMKSLGVPELIAHVRGEIGLEAAVAAAKAATRRYAKRQDTWNRHQMIAWEPVFEQEIESQIHKIFSFIDDCGLTLS